MAENLARMGSATVRLINLNGVPAIHKQDVSCVELCFYRYIAPDLRRKGLHVPLVVELNTATHDLFLEYIPYAVTQNELWENPAFIQMLSVVHSHPLTACGPLHKHYWSDKACDITYKLLNLSAEARSTLQRVKSVSDVLFFQDSMIWGDSNAGNWARRASGDIVLFDWERFGHGSVAIDLAPLIKGMGTSTDYYALAQRYSRINRRYAAKELSREIAICKAWIATEVIMLLYTRQKAELALYTAWYKNNFPDWLTQISKCI